jgi:hypothetical protein
VCLEEESISDNEDKPEEECENPEDIQESSE